MVQPILVGFFSFFGKALLPSFLKIHFRVIPSILYSLFFSRKQTGTISTFYSDGKRVTKSELGFWSFLDFCLCLAWKVS